MQIEVEKDHIHRHLKEENSKLNAQVQNNSTEDQEQNRDLEIQHQILEEIRPTHPLSFQPQNRWRKNY